MQVITMSTEAYQHLMKRIDEIADNSKKCKESTIATSWLDIQEACQALKISKRTLQSYRDNGILPYSKIGGKIYFKAEDIREHLEKHYVKPSKRRF